MKTNYKLKHNIELAITKKFNQTNKSKQKKATQLGSLHHNVCMASMACVTVSRRATVRNTKVLSKCGFYFISLLQDLA